MKREELDVGEYYKCSLSGNKVLINSSVKTDTAKGETIVVTAKYYNKVTGLYEQVTINDNQLEAL